MLQAIENTGEIKSNLLDNDPEKIVELIEWQIKTYFNILANGGEAPFVPDHKVKIELDNFNNPIKTWDELRDLQLQENFLKASYRREDMLAWMGTNENVVNLITGILIPLLNQNLAMRNTGSHEATFNEISVLMRMRELAGYSVDENPQNLRTVGGFFMTGSTMGMMAATLVARNKMFPDSKKTGLQGIAGKAKMLIPHHVTHYSARDSFDWMGLGTDNVIEVPSKDFKFDLPELEKTIKQLKDNGDKPMIVVISLGDIYAMNIDNIKEVHKLCQEHGIWLHADGSNGANLMFSKKYRHLIDGLELCDSFSCDFHKVLGIGYPNSVFLCKDPEDFNSVLSEWNFIMRADSLDWSTITPFLTSRAFDALKIWTTLKIFGVDGVGEMIDRKIDALRDMYAQMQDLKNEGRINFTTGKDPETFNLLFQVVPPEMRPIEDLSLLSDEELRQLSDYQQKFKDEFDSEGRAKLGCFSFPLSCITGKAKDKERRLNTLSVRNTHESIPHYVTSELLEALREYSDTPLFETKPQAQVLEVI